MVIRVGLVGNLEDVNQIDTANILASHKSLKPYVITDAVNYSSRVQVPANQIYHVRPSNPATLARIHPLDQRRFARVLEDISPDVLLVMGITNLIFLPSTVETPPTVLLPQGGEKSRATGTAQWTDSRLRLLYYRLIYRPMFQELVQKVDEIWAPEPNRSIMRQFGVESKFVPFDWAAVDCDTFYPAEDPVSFATGGTVVAGSFRRLRGNRLASSVETFLDACGRLHSQDRDFHVVIGGIYKTGQSTDIQTLIGEKISYHGLGDHVSTLELVPKEELPQYYSGLDMYVNFTHRGVAGGLGTAAKEAMACGCAILAFDDPDPSYAVSDGVNGDIVGIGNVDEVLTALDRCIRDETALETRKRAAISTVRERFSFEAVSARIRERCERLVTDGGEK